MIFGPPAPPLVYHPAPYVCPIKRTHYGCVPTKPRVHIDCALVVVRLPDGRIITVCKAAKVRRH